MAHLLPHWTWPERVGQITPVHVFTSGDEAELFLNGRSLGRKKRGPLEYRRWRPGENLINTVWDIPIPEKREIVTPALVLAPLVGFDRSYYRLGYVGSYFDRTLAALRPCPFAIGIGFEFQQLETIHPQPFDIPMGLIVTEVGLRR